MFTPGNGPTVKVLPLKEDYLAVSIEQRDEPTIVFAIHVSTAIILIDLLVSATAQKREFSVVYPNETPTDPHSPESA